MARLNLRIFFIDRKRHFPKPALFLQGIRNITWPIKSFCVCLKKALTFVGRSIRRLLHRPSDSGQGNDLEPGHRVRQEVDSPSEEQIFKSQVEEVRQNYRLSLQAVFGNTELVQQIIQSIQDCKEKR